MSIDSGVFAPAYVSARAIGMTSGAIISSLIICPAIFADWLYLSLCKSAKWEPPKEQPNADIRVYDLAHLIAHEEIKSSVIYQGGFFTASRPLKIAAELAGSLCCAMASATTFIIVGLLEMTLGVAAIPPLLILGAAAIFAGSIYCLVRSYQTGFQEQCVETVNYLSEKVL